MQRHRTEHVGELTQLLVVARKNKMIWPRGERDDDQAEYTFVILEWETGRLDEIDANSTLYLR